MCVYKHVPVCSGCIHRNFVHFCPPWDELEIFIQESGIVSSSASLLLLFFFNREYPRYWNSLRLLLAKLLEIF